MKKIAVIVCVSFLCCELSLLSGCGSHATLTPAEQAEVDKYIKEHGRGAIPPYLNDATEDQNTDEKRVLKYLKYFVSQGADVNVKGEEAATALHWAVWRGNADIVKFLVSKGADVNAKEVRGITPLHVAIVKFLVSKGADVNAKEVRGITPLYVASVAPSKAAKIQNIDIVKFLVSKGADVNVKAEYDSTPLHLAAASGCIDIVKFLVSKGADVNVKRQDGSTPLHLAVASGCIDIVKFLVSKGADVNAKNNKTKTPPEVAIERGDFELLKILAKTDGRPPDGKVVFSDDGSPVPIGTVCFETDTYFARGDLKPDGTFVVGSLKANDGLPSGKYRVYISGAQKSIGQDKEGMDIYASLIDEKFASGSTSGITIDVTSRKKYIEIKVDRYNPRKP